MLFILNIVGCIYFHLHLVLGSSLASLLISFNILNIENINMILKLKSIQNSIYSESYYKILHFLI